MFSKSIRWIAHYINPHKITYLPEGQYPEDMPESETFRYCLVGNIMETHTHGEDKQVKHGTKHFSAGTKVYCADAHWGEAIKVIGLHRKSKRLICIIMPSKLITNWRMQAVYAPRVLALMQEHHFWTGSSKRVQEGIQRLAASLQERDE